MAATGAGNGRSENAGDSASSQGSKHDQRAGSTLKKIWAKIGLSPPLVMMMFKGSVPPLISIAFYQADAVARYYSTLGYLVAIISILSLSILPRAKFLQNLILNALGVCIGSAVALLGLWSSVQARKHTTPKGTVAAYNSSQSAVCAVWLFFSMWFVSVMRAKFPAFQMPAIMFSILTDIGFTSGPRFQTTAQCEAFIKELLTSFFTAFGIAAGVSLFIFPVSSRTVVFKGMAGYIEAVQKTLKAQSAYLQSLEKSDMFAVASPPENGQENKKAVEDSAEETDAKPTKSLESPESVALKQAATAISGLYGKINGDLAFGKMEFAWGKLDQSDLNEITVHFRSILIPLVGMSTITHIFERIAERRGWIRSTTPVEEAEEWEKDPDFQTEQEEKNVWNDVMKQLHTPFAIATEIMDENMQHAGILLELLPRPNKKKDNSTSADVDVEADGDGIKIGELGFAEYTQEKMTKFYAARGETLRLWAQRKGITQEDFEAADASTTDGPKSFNAKDHRRDQQQLYLILYMEHLLYSTGMSITKLALFAEKKVSDGRMKKNHFIIPGQRRIRKWIISLGNNEDSAADDGNPDLLHNGQNVIYLGAGFNKKKDPEHLPATSKWERIGDGIRTIPGFFSSVEAAFGLRAACATMTIAIIAFLESTQVFFVEQRLVWAMIIIAISLMISAGQTMFGFFTRAVGTAVAMVNSFIIWYIVDQKVPGVIVMLWFFIFIEFYFFLKFPRYLPMYMICIVTQVLIIGYELQVVKIGVAAAVASGQRYYPVYELAPYRLACVSAGSLVAFIWTVFPYPLSNRTGLRKDLGATIYLLANYYSVVHETIKARINNVEGDMGDRESPGRRLQHVRHKSFGKLLLLLASLRQHAEWQKWELSIGGRFPREKYEAITSRVEKILQYMALMSYATQTFSSETDEPATRNKSHRIWLDDLSKLMKTVNPTSHSITSVLSLLSASVTQGSALPPYMQIPEPFLLSRRLEALDKGILDIRHVEEPGYSAYAVMQVTSSLIHDELIQLVQYVKELVGEVDFAFEVVTASTDSFGKGEGGGKGKKD